MDIVTHPPAIRYDYFVWTESAPSLSIIYCGLSFLVLSPPPPHLSHAIYCVWNHTLSQNMHVHLSEMATFLRNLTDFVCLFVVGIIDDDDDNLMSFCLPCTHVVC